MDATKEEKEEQKKEEQEKPVFSGDGSNDQDNLLSAGNLDLWTDEYEKPDKDPLPIHHRAVDGLASDNRERTVARDPWRRHGSSPRGRTRDRSAISREIQS